MLGRARLQEALADARAARAEAEALRRDLEAERLDLVHAVNHQFRTPLTNILGYTEVLLEDPTWEPPPAHRDVIARIHRNAERLHREMNLVRMLSPVGPGPNERSGSETA